MKQAVTVDESQNSTSSTLPFMLMSLDSARIEKDGTCICEESKSRAPTSVLKSTYKQ